MSARMTCRSCGRSYRVPHTDKTWHCKACGEPLISATDEPPAAPADDAAAKEERKRVNAELKRWRKTLKGLKAYCIIAPAVLLGLFGVLLGLGFLAQGEPISAALCVGAVIGVGVGAWLSLGFIEHRPVLTLSIIAVPVTMNAIGAVLMAVASGTSDLSRLLISAPLAILMCGAVLASIPRARRGQELMRAHPDAHRRKESWERAEVQGESVRERRRATARRAGKGESRVALWVLLGAACLAILGGAGYWYSQQPDDPSSTLQAFHASWEAGDVDAIAGHARSETIERGLRRYWEKQEWAESPPDLVGWEHERRSKVRVAADYEFADGRVSTTRWSWEADRWTLTQFGFPKH